MISVPRLPVDPRKLPIVGNRLPLPPAPVRPPRPGSRRVLVTGGASGLGLEFVTQLLDAGDTVIVTDLAPTDSRPATVPEEAHYLRLDVRSEAEWIEARDAVTEQFGGLDVLINNAGIAQGGRIEYLTESDWSEILDINLHGPARGARVFVPLFKEQGSGYILNVASLAGIAHPPAMSSYTAVKAGVRAMSESLRWELEASGIGVSVLCPSFFRTNLAESLNDSDTEISVIAGKLINRSTLDVRDVAAGGLRGMNAGRFLILPDPDARQTRTAKFLAPALYESKMREMARRFAAAVAG